MSKKCAIKVYHGFGHKQDIVVFGHAFQKLKSWGNQYSDRPFSNFRKLISLFFVRPIARVPLQLKWNGQIVDGHTESDGFFRIEWKSTDETAAGWHPTEVATTPGSGYMKGRGIGEIFIPHITQFGFISDIDDTVMLSHSGTIGRRLKELLFKNPHSRTIFNDVVEYYRLLAGAHTSPEAPNPFFYVSSSEWNLYDYLNEVFSYHGLPKGAFLLNQVKRWYEFWRTGKTKHEGKLLRILRVLQVFPKQRFVLLGDNSQSDPAIYAKLAMRFPDRIMAIYIRNVSKENEKESLGIFDTLSDKGIHCLLYKNTNDAIVHSKKIGLIK